MTARSHSATFLVPALGLLAGSEDSRAREKRPPHHGARRERGLRERGIALVLAMTTVAILAVVLADMHEATSTSYALASTERDQLRAEYLARSGINLTRFLIAQEAPIRQAVTPILQPLMVRAP
jgi:general secretion pathway protein K